MKRDLELKMNLKTILSEHLSEPVLPQKQKFNFLPNFYSSNDVPVLPTQVSWSRDTTSLKKEFSFSNRHSLREFVEKILDYEDNIGMFCNVQIFEKTVTVTVSSEHSKRFKSMLEEFANETGGY